MRLFAAFMVLLSGCSTAPIPKQPEVPTSISNLNATQGSVDGKVAASVTVAIENKDKPAVVEAEGKVALAALPPPSESELAIARLRVIRNVPQDYVSAVEQGKALTARIQSDLAKVKADQAEAKRISDLKDARIAELQRKLADSDGRLWTIAGIALVIIGGLIWWFLKDTKGASIIAGVGLMCGAYPRVLDSPWFMWIAIVSLAFCAVLAGWWAFDKVRDSVNKSK